MDLSPFFDWQEWLFVWSRSFKPFNVNVENPDNTVEILMTIHKQWKSIPHDCKAQQWCAPHILALDNTGLDQLMASQQKHIILKLKGRCFIVAMTTKLSHQKHVSLVTLVLCCFILNGIYRHSAFQLFPEVFNALQSPLNITETVFVYLIIWW